MTEPREREPESRFPPISRGKKVLLVLSLLIGLSGVALTVFGSEGGGAPKAAPPAAAAGGTSPLPASGFQPGTTPFPSPTPSAEPAPESDSGSSAWGPAVTRLGFSFFVGFAVAYALRAFFKITLIVLGALLLVMFGLQYAGFVQVDWSALGRGWDSLSGWLGQHAGGFRDFLTGNLPSAASAAAGLALGFRRR